MSANDLLAHAVKALAYRFIKATTGSTDSFGGYKLNSHTRSPNEILNHMYDLVVKTRTMIQQGHFNCPIPEVLPFEPERDRLINGLGELRTAIESHQIEDDVCGRLLQGPLLDLASHIGQLAMLTGLNGTIIQRENYYRADIS
ncbi:hypothetical protein IC229_22035 [Spirosoma sp. BT702]|uniref:DinB family protein n=1 Tax=Spirosoma profusum TaxID=2771354 RepID=A0A926Y4N9_9BACT|nr:hypothetical protein [Spirosoma profusum]MBD2703341.1 hypothetical protein [Spirosoma profusum]